MDAPGGAIDPLYATASRDQATGEVTLKVVNFSGTDQQIDVHLEGVQNVANTASAQVLTGQPNDVNTVETPEKVAPKTVRLKGIGRTFGHTFPAYSVSVLRLKAQ